ncbi:isocitrate lyase/PEP mutase family protein [Taklimakanibacter deserti]|uniref:isocitrate lyase/PEP mutase family protein n=1 Tax=Taklimakanibacter deserti TaxID=2267839 RepID=UPI000E65CCD6
MATQLEKAETLRALHHRGCAFIIPNPWDAGSARLLADAGFEALATTSAGIAFSRGLPDGILDTDAILANAVEIAQAVNLPVSVDLEHGYGDTPESVERTIRRTLDLGLAGGSIEDSTGRPDAPIYEFGLAVERIRAAADAVRGQAIPFQLVARAENFLHGRPDLADTIRRLQAFQEAGADVLYAPGLRTAEQIRDVVGSIDRPLNVVMGLVGADLTVDQLSKLGVARISIGSALARRIYGAVIDAAAEMMEKGSFTFAEAATPMQRLNGIFAAWQRKAASIGVS